MKKIFIIALLILSFISIHQAKKQAQSNGEEDSQIEPNRQRSCKKTKQSRKHPRSSKTKKNKKNIKQRLNHHSEQNNYLHWDQPAFWWNSLLAIFLSCAGGFFSGMTVGLNSLDKLTLEVQQITGNQQEKKRASRILNTIKDHHLFLVTLLVGNAMVLQYLPLVVHKLMPDWAAILMSTFAVVIVAEIVPMAYTTGPSKYKAAYFCAPIVDLCIKVYYVIAYPIARGLDRLLGVHDNTHIKRADFLAFVNDKKKNHLKPLQITMFNQFFVGSSFTSVQNIMTPVNQFMVLEMSDEVTKEIVQRIIQDEVRFILIARNSKQAHDFNISAAIKTKQFVRSYLKKNYQLKKSNIKISQFIEPSFVFEPQNRPSKDEALKYNHENKIPAVYTDTGLLDLLGIMRAKKSSIALVHKDQRRNQSTDITFLDANDFQVPYNPSSIQEKHSIIGVVMIDNIFQAITDFNNEITPQFEIKKQDSPVKKRKLIKKASIVSEYSARSQRSFS